MFKSRVLKSFKNSAGFVATFLLSLMLGLSLTYFSVNAASNELVFTIRDLYENGINFTAEKTNLRKASTEYNNGEITYGYNSSTKSYNYASLPTSTNNIYSLYELTADSQGNDYFKELTNYRSTTANVIGNSTESFLPTYADYNYKNLFYKQNNTYYPVFYDVNNYTQYNPLNPLNNDGNDPFYILNNYEEQNNLSKVITTTENVDNLYLSFGDYYFENEGHIPHIPPIIITSFVLEATLTNNTYKNGIRVGTNTTGSTPQDENEHSLGTTYFGNLIYQPLTAGQTTFGNYFWYTYLDLSSIYSIDTDYSSNFLIEDSEGRYDLVFTFNYADTNEPNNPSEVATFTYSFYLENESSYDIYPYFNDVVTSGSITNTNSDYRNYYYNFLEREYPSLIYNPTKYNTSYTYKLNDLINTFSTKFINVSNYNYGNFTYNSSLLLLYKNTYVNNVETKVFYRSVAMTKIIERSDNHTIYTYNYYVSKPSTLESSRIKVDVVTSGGTSSVISFLGTENFEFNNAVKYVEVTLNSQTSTDIFSQTSNYKYLQTYYKDKKSNQFVLKQEDLTLDYSSLEYNSPAYNIENINYYFTNMDYDKDSIFYTHLEYENLSGEEKGSFTAFDDNYYVSNTDNFKFVINSNEYDTLNEPDKVSYIKLNLLNFYVAKFDINYITNAVVTGSSEIYYNYLDFVENESPALNELEKYISAYTVVKSVLQFSGKTALKISKPNFVEYFNTTTDVFTFASESSGAMGKATYTLLDFNYNKEVDLKYNFYPANAINNIVNLSAHENYLLNLEFSDLGLYDIFIAFTETAAILANENIYDIATNLDSFNIKVGILEDDENNNGITQSPTTTIPLANNANSSLSVPVASDTYTNNSGENKMYTPVVSISYDDNLGDYAVGNPISNVTLYSTNNLVGVAGQSNQAVTIIGKIEQYLISYTQSFNVYTKYKDGRIKQESHTENFYEYRAIGKDLYYCSHVNSETNAIEYYFVYYNNDSNAIGIISTSSSESLFINGEGKVLNTYFNSNLSGENENVYFGYYYPLNDSDPIGATEGIEVSLILGNETDKTATLKNSANSVLLTGTYEINSSGILDKYTITFYKDGDGNDVDSLISIAYLEDLSLNFYSGVLRNQFLRNSSYITEGVITYFYTNGTDKFSVNINKTITNKDNNTENVDLGLYKFYSQLNGDNMLYYYNSSNDNWTSNADYLFAYDYSNENGEISSYSAFIDDNSVNFVGQDSFVISSFTNLAIGDIVNNTLKLVHTDKTTSYTFEPSSQAANIDHEITHSYDDTPYTSVTRITFTETAIVDITEKYDYYYTFDTSPQFLLKCTFTKTYQVENTYNWFAYIDNNFKNDPDFLIVNIDDNHEITQEEINNYLANYYCNCHTYLEEDFKDVHLYFINHTFVDTLTNPILYEDTIEIVYTESELYNSGFTAEFNNSNKKTAVTIEDSATDLLDRITTYYNNGTLSFTYNSTYYKFNCNGGFNWVSSGGTFGSPTQYFFGKLKGESLSNGANTLDYALKKESDKYYLVGLSNDVNAGNITSLENSVYTYEGTLKSTNNNQILFYNSGGSDYFIIEINLSNKQFGVSTDNIKFISSEKENSTSFASSLFYENVSYSFAEIEIKDWKHTSNYQTIISLNTIIDGTATELARGSYTREGYFKNLMNSNGNGVTNNTELNPFTISGNKITFSSVTNPNITPLYTINNTTFELNLGLSGIESGVNFSYYYLPSSDENYNHSIKIFEQNIGSSFPYNVEIQIFTSLAINGEAIFTYYYAIWEYKYETIKETDNFYIDNENKNISHITATINGITSEGYIYAIKDGEIFIDTFVIFHSGDLSNSFRKQTLINKNIVVNTSFSGRATNGMSLHLFGNKSWFNKNGYIEFRDDNNMIYSDITEELNEKIDNNLYDYINTQYTNSKITNNWSPITLTDDNNDGIFNTLTAKVPVTNLPPVNFTYFCTYKYNEANPLISESYIYKYKNYVINEDGTVTVSQKDQSKGWVSYNRYLNDSSLTYYDFSYSTFTKNTLLNDDGYYEIIVRYAYDQYDLSENKIFYQVYAFVIDKSNPIIVMEKEVEDKYTDLNIIDQSYHTWKVLENQAYINSSVRLKWITPNYFQADISPYISKINYSGVITSGINTNGSIATQINSDGKYPNTNYVLYGQTLRAGQSTGGLSNRAYEEGAVFRNSNKSEINLINGYYDENEYYTYMYIFNSKDNYSTAPTYFGSGNYSVRISHGATGTAYISQAFTMDTISISGLKIIPVEYNQGSYKYSTTAFLSSDKYINQNFSFIYNFKTSGSPITTTYYKIPFKQLAPETQQIILTNNTYLEESLGIINSYILNAASSNTNKSNPYSYVNPKGANITAGETISSNNVFMPSTSNIYVFTLKDSAGNTAQYYTFYDCTLPEYAIDTQEDYNTRYNIITDTAKIMWGNYKAIKIDNSTTPTHQGYINEHYVFDGVLDPRPTAMSMLLHDINTDSQNNFAGTMVKRFIKEVVNNTTNYVEIKYTYNEQSGTNMYYKYNKTLKEWGPFSLSNQTIYYFIFVPIDKVSINYFETNSNNYTKYSYIYNSKLTSITPGTDALHPASGPMAPYTTLYPTLEIFRTAIENSSYSVLGPQGFYGEMQYYFTISDKLGNKTITTAWMNFDKSQAFAKGNFNISTPTKFQNDIIEEYLSENSAYSLSQLYFSFYVENEDIGIPASQISYKYYPFKLDFDYNISNITYNSETNQFEITYGETTANIKDNSNSTERGEPMPSYPFSLTTASPNSNYLGVENGWYIIADENTQTNPQDILYDSTDENRWYSDVVNPATYSIESGTYEITRQGLYIFKRVYITTAQILNLAELFNTYKLTAQFQTLYNAYVYNIVEDNNPLYKPNINSTEWFGEITSDDLLEYLHKEYSIKTGNGDDIPELITNQTEFLQNLAIKSLIGRDTITRYYVYYVDRNGIIEVELNTTNISVGNSISFVLGSEIDGVNQNYQHTIAAEDIYSNTEVNSQTSNKSHKDDIVNGLFSSNKEYINLNIPYDKYIKSEIFTKYLLDLNILYYENNTVFYNYEKIINIFGKLVNQWLGLSINTNITPTLINDSTSYKTTVQNQVNSMFSKLLFNIDTSELFKLNISLILEGANEESKDIVKNNSVTNQNKYILQSGDINDTFASGDLRGESIYLFQRNTKLQDLYSQYSLLITDSAGIPLRNNANANCYNITFSITDELPSGMYFGKNNSSYYTNSSAYSEIGYSDLLFGKNNQYGDYTNLINLTDENSKTRNYTVISATNNKTLIFSFDITANNQEAEINPYEITIIKEYYNSVGNLISETIFERSKKYSESTNYIKNVNEQGQALDSSIINKMRTAFISNTEQSKFAVVVFDSYAFNPIYKNLLSNPDDNAVYIAKIQYYGARENYIYYTDNGENSFFSTSFEISIDNLKPMYNLLKLMEKDEYVPLKNTNISGISTVLNIPNFTDIESLLKTKLLNYLTQTYGPGSQNYTDNITNNGYKIAYANISTKSTLSDILYYIETLNITNSSGDKMFKINSSFELYMQYLLNAYFGEYYKSYVILDTNNNSQYYMDGDQQLLEKTKLQNYFFAVDSNFVFENISSADSSAHIYFRAIGKYTEPQYINYKFSVTTDDMPNVTGELQQNDHPVFVEADSVTLNQNIEIEFNTYYQVTYSNNLYQLNALKTQFFDKGFTYIEVIEKDQAGNYRVYAICVIDNNNNITYTYQNESYILNGNLGCIDQYTNKINGTNLIFNNAIDNYSGYKIENNKKVWTDNKNNTNTDLFVSAKIHYHFSKNINTIDDPLYVTSSVIQVGGVNYTENYFNNQPIIIYNDPLNKKIIIDYGDCNLYYIFKYADLSFNSDIFNDTSLKEGNLGQFIFILQKVYNSIIDNYGVIASDFKIDIEILLRNAENMKITYNYPGELLKYTKETTSTIMSISIPQDSINRSTVIVKFLAYRYSNGSWLLLETDDASKRINTGNGSTSIAENATANDLTYTFGAGSYKFILTDNFNRTKTWFEKYKVENINTSLNYDIGIEKNGILYTAGNISLTYDASIYKPFIYFYNANGTVNSSYLNLALGINNVTINEKTFTINLSQSNYLYNISFNAPNEANQIFEIQLVDISTGALDNKEYTYSNSTIAEITEVIIMKFAMYKILPEMVFTNMNGQKISNIKNQTFIENLNVYMDFSNLQNLFNAKLCFIIDNNTNNVIYSYDSYEIIQSGTYKIFITNDLGYNSAGTVNYINLSRIQGTAIYYSINTVKLESGSGKTSQTQLNASPSIKQMISDDGATYPLYVYFTTTIFNNWKDDSGIKSPDHSKSHIEVVVNTSRGVTYEFYGYGTENIASENYYYILYKMMIGTNNEIFRFVKIYFINSTTNNFSNMSIKYADVSLGNCAEDNIVLNNNIKGTTPEISVMFKTEYNKIAGNEIEVQHYLNGYLYKTFYVSSLQTKIIDNTKYFYFTTDVTGLHKFIVKDLAENTTVFSNNAYFNFYLINAVIYTINEAEPIINRIYNSQVSVRVVYGVANTNITFYNNPVEISVTKNGMLLPEETYKVTTSSLTRYVFNEIGYYEITFLATIITGTNETKTLRTVTSFKIVNSNVAITNFDIANSNNFTLVSVQRKAENSNNAKYITLSLTNYNNYLNENGYTNSILWLSSADEFTGSGYYEIVLRAYIKRTNQYQDFVFNVWINDSIPSITSNIDFGSSSKSEITFSFNPYSIYTKIGNSKIVLIKDSTVIQEMIINSASENVILKSIIVEAGNYWIQIYSEDDKLISSYKLIKQDPLNEVSKIIIIVVTIGVIGLTILFIVMRKKANFK